MIDNKKIDNEKTSTGVIANAILDVLADNLQPMYLKLDNESHQHAGYFDGKESHFRLVVASQAFKDMRLVARHQVVYALVAPWMSANGGSIHALAIFAYSLDEWEKQAVAPQSPNCLGQKSSI